MREWDAGSGRRRAKARETGSGKSEVGNRGQGTEKSKSGLSRSGNLENLDGNLEVASRRLRLAILFPIMIARGE
jgi:hypothetical protein